MPRYTELSEKEISNFAESFNIGKVVDFKSLTEGYTNSSFQISTKKGDYILTICEDKSFEQITNLTKLLNHLEIHGYKTTRVIKDKNGEFICDYQNRPVYLKEFLPGENVVNPNFELISDIGQMIAKLHKISPTQDIPNSHPYGIKHFHEVINSQISHPFKIWLEQKLSYLQDQMHPGLPEGLVHGDVFADNIIQKKENLVAIIDFEETSKSPLIFDIGMAIIGLFAEADKIDLEKAKALVSGYQTIRHLKPLEKAQLKVFCIYGAVSTAFWRFKQKYIRYPDSKNSSRHEQMVNFADTLVKMDNHDFVDQIF